MKNDRNNDAGDDPAFTQLVKAEISIEDLATISGFLIVQAREEDNGEMEFAEHFAHQVIHQCQQQGFEPQEVVDCKHDAMFVSFSVPVIAVAGVGMVIQEAMKTTPAAECLKAPWSIFVKKASYALGIRKEPKRFDAFGAEDLN